MEEKNDRKSSGSPRTGAEVVSVIDAIRAVCANNARAPIDTEARLLLFLKSWWSRTYNKPLKDPILATYTLEELLYEFYDKVERAAAADENELNEQEKIETDKEKADLDWAAQEELKELEAAKRNGDPTPVKDPTKDPKNIQWMEEEIRKNKVIYGETFGEDIEDSFE